MKIVYVVSNLERCGPINVLFNIIKVANLKNNCSIITLSPENEKTMISDFEKLGINILSLNLDRNSGSNSYKLRLKKVIAELNPDIIHTHGFRSDKYINLINRDATLNHITTLHNFPFSDYPRLYGFIPGILLSIFHLLVIKKIEHKIACSHSIAKKLKFFSGISVIQNGVDINKFKPLSKAMKDKLRLNLNLPLDKKIIISTGAMIKRKRPKRLVEAFKKGSWNNQVIFLVLGDGQLLKEIKREESEHIKILGSVGNVTDYLQASDIFISNSKAEGLPMAMLEAAAVGLIIIGTNISPHIEVKDLYTNRTILYKGQSISEIIQKISEAVNRINKYTSVSNEYIENFSSEKMANQYLMYYQSMMVK